MSSRLRHIDWGLRDYSLPPIEWPDGWRGSLGLEPTPELYIEHLVGIFREVKRVLRDDGSMWLNIAGAYYGGKPHKAGETNPGKEYYIKDVGAFGTTDKSVPHAILKPKDWVPIPWMLGMALQRDGWWLRSPIIWAKGLSFCETYSGSVMPESVRDRPTTSYEYLLLLTKSARYFYDNDAVREAHNEKTGRDPRTINSGGLTNGLIKRGAANQAAGGRGFFATQKGGRVYNPAGRNLRSVWAINPHPFKDAHFATFPPKLVEPCIKAGTSERGCCPECGKGWERVVERNVAPVESANAIRAHGGLGNRLGGQAQQNWKDAHPNRTIGWRPGCDCYQLFECAYCQYEDRAPTYIAECPRCGGPISWLSPKASYEKEQPDPCIVLDPFVGSGTTVMVALRLGRRAIGIDLSEEYCQMARKRIIQDNPMFNTPGEAT